jgi:hypothetical protein
VGALWCTTRAVSDVTAQPTSSSSKAWKLQEERARDQALTDCVQRRCWGQAPPADELVGRFGGQSRFGVVEFPFGVGELLAHLTRGRRWLVRARGLVVELVGESVDRCPQHRACLLPAPDGRGAAGRGGVGEQVGQRPGPAAVGQLESAGEIGDARRVGGQAGVGPYGDCLDAGDGEVVGGRGAEDVDAEPTDVFLEPLDRGCGADRGARRVAGAQLDVGLGAEHLPRARGRVAGRQAVGQPGDRFLRQVRMTEPEQDRHDDEPGRRDTQRCRLVAGLDHRANRLST